MTTEFDFSSAQAELPSDDSRELHRPFGGANDPKDYGWRSPEIIPERPLSFRVEGPESAPTDTSAQGSLFDQDSAVVSLADGQVRGNDDDDFWGQGNLFAQVAAEVQPCVPPTDKETNGGEVDDDTGGLSGMEFAKRAADAIRGRTGRDPTFAAQLGHAGRDRAASALNKLNNRG